MNPSDVLAPVEPLGAQDADAPLLLFRFGAGLWALPALAVREIHALPMLSPLPEVAPWVMGMFVLRGEIVPVVDLGARFGEPSDPPCAGDALIVLDFAGAPWRYWRARFARCSVFRPRKSARRPPMAAKSGSPRRL